MVYTREPKPVASGDMEQGLSKASSGEKGATKLSPALHSAMLAVVTVQTQGERHQRDTEAAGIERSHGQNGRGLPAQNGTDGGGGVPGEPMALQVLGKIPVQGIRPIQLNATSSEPS